MTGKITFKIDKQTAWHTYRSKR